MQKNILIFNSFEQIKRPNTIVGIGLPLTTLKGQFIGNIITNIA